MTELPLSGVPPRLFPCTPSKLTAWLDCPRRYRMAYVDRPTPAKGPAWAHNSFGATVHNALKNWWSLPVQRRDAAGAAGLVDTGWLGDGYRDEAQAADFRGRARAMVSRYVARLDPAREPVGVERHVAARTSQLALAGRVDRIDERDGDLVIVDYKTGQRALSSDDARGSLALAAYAFAVSRMFHKPVRRVELHHLPSDATHTWTHSDESLDRQLQRISDIAVEARGAKEFPARPGPLCSWCDFRSACPEGRAATEARRPWEGLHDDEMAPVEEIA